MTPRHVLAPGAGERLVTGPGTEVVVKATSATTGGGLYAAEVVAGPRSGGPPPHVHDRLHDIFYVLEGTLTLHVEGEEVTAGAGTFACFPPGVVHTFRNDSDAPVRVLNLSTPGGFEAYIRDLADAAAGPPDPGRLAAIVDRHDIRIEEHRSTTMTDDTGIETPHELVLTTDLPATPAAVWDAWTDPASFATWWVGPGFVTRPQEMDVRPGGRFSVRQAAPDGSMTIPFDGFYREAEPGRRLVIALGDGASAAAPARTEMTVTLEATADGTRQRFTQTGVVSDEHFEQLEAGTRLFFAQLHDQLAGAEPA